MTCNYPGQSFGRTHQSRFFFLINSISYIFYIITLIGISGELNVDITKLQIAEPDTYCKDVHLPPGVVDVILTFNPITCCL